MAHHSTDLHPGATFFPSKAGTEPNTGFFKHLRRGIHSVTSRLQSMRGCVLRALIFEFLPMEKANTRPAGIIFKKLN
jgi:hypothetical protein